MFALGLLWLARQSAAGKRWRSSWGTWDWVGLAVLVVGIAVGFSALMDASSTSWRETTGFYKDRVLAHGVWAFGALSIGIGSSPRSSGRRPRPSKERARPRRRPGFVVTSVAALAAFVWYAGSRARTSSTSSRRLLRGAKRHLPRSDPLRLDGDGPLPRRRPRTGDRRSRGVHGHPSSRARRSISSQHPFDQAHGLSIAAFVNRELGLVGGCTIEDAPLRRACTFALAVVVALGARPPGSTVSFAAVAGYRWRSSVVARGRTGLGLTQPRASESISEQIDSKSAVAVLTGSTR